MMKPNLIKKRENHSLSCEYAKKQGINQINGLLPPLSSNVLSYLFFFIIKVIFI